MRQRTKSLKSSKNVELFRENDPGRSTENCRRRISWKLLRRCSWKVSREVQRAENISFQSENYRIISWKWLRLTMEIMEFFRENDRGRSPEMYLQNFAVKMALFDDGNNGIFSWRRSWKFFRDVKAKLAPFDAVRWIVRWFDEKKSKVRKNAIVWKWKM